MYDGFVVVVTLFEKIEFGESFLSSLNNSEYFPVLFFFSLQCSFVLQQYIFCKVDFCIVALPWHNIILRTYPRDFQPSSWIS